MYILSKHFETPAEQEIVCPWTGESYVYVECDSLSAIDSKYHEGALETLPRRFYQQPIVFNKGGRQVQIMVRKPYDY
jgi:hypothetical protein